jgi:chromate transporter
MADRDDAGPRRRELAALAGLFLKLGTTAFGGPAAHIAMMEEEVVRRRRWLSHEELLDLVGASHLIPGPTSTELAIHIGHRRAGWPGLLVAGACFILPAALITAALAWAYVRWGRLPAAGALLYGIKPVLIVIVLQALWGLGRTALRVPALAGLALAAGVASLAGAHELLVLGGAGLAAIPLRWRPARPGGSGAPPAAAAAVLPPFALAAPAAGAAAAIAAAPGTIFAVFAKIGALLFGSGYVLLAFLRSDLVERRHWLTEQQLLDAIAAGQITPGPFFSTATFIGYLLAGGAGAAAATAGIFAPAFVFVAASGPLVPRLRRSALASAILDGVNAAALALMATVAWQLGRAAIVDPPTAVIAVAAALAVVALKVGSTGLLIAGALSGVLIDLLL